MECIDVDAVDSFTEIVIIERLHGLAEYAEVECMAVVDNPSAKQRAGNGTSDDAIS